MPVQRFGVFELDPDGGELHRQGRRVHLAAQPFKVLCLLTSRPGVVVTREELRQHVWGDDTFVEFDRGLNFCIAAVRAALHDEARSPRFIETLPRRGYRFIADVRSNEIATPVATQPARIRGSAFRRWSWVAVVPLLLAQRPASPATHTRTTTKPEALAAFEQGRQATTQGVAGLRRSVHDFRQATRLDPRFAEAHYALADVYLNLAGRHELPQASAMEEARGEALQAVALEDVAESRQILGTVRLLHDWDWDGARRDLARALAMAPKWDSGLVSYARFLSAAGDDRAALAMIDRAETLSPSCDLILRESGLIHARAGRFTEAAQKMGDAIVFGPPHGVWAGDWQREVRFRLVLMHASRHEWPAARANAVAILAISGASASQRTPWLSGDPREWVQRFLEQSLDRMTARVVEDKIPPTRIAALHAVLSHEDAAVDWLERAATERDPDLVYALRDPEFAGLLGNVRFRALDAHVRGWSAARALRSLAAIADLLVARARFETGSSQPSHRQ